MRFLSWVSAVSGAAAVACLLAFTVGVPEWRSALIAVRLPLEFDEPEALLAFVPSLLLGSVALVAGLPVVARGLGRAGIVLGVLTWLGVFLLIGTRGFYTLF